MGKEGSVPAVLFINNVSTSDCLYIDNICL